MINCQHQEDKSCFCLNDREKSENAVHKGIGTVPELTNSGAHGRA
jgi:hypothetical protein